MVLLCPQTHDAVPSELHAPGLIRTTGGRCRAFRNLAELLARPILWWSCPLTCPRSLPDRPPEVLVIPPDHPTARCLAGPVPSDQPALSVSRQSRSVAKVVSTAAPIPTEAVAYLGHAHCGRGPDRSRQQQKSPRWLRRRTVQSLCKQNYLRCQGITPFTFYLVINGE